MMLRTKKLHKIKVEIFYFFIEKLTMDFKLAKKLIVSSSTKNTLSGSFDIL